MYNGNLGINELLGRLQEIPELTKWRISLENDGCLMPMDTVATRKQIAKVCVAAQRNMKPMPTDAMCFKEGTDTVEDSMAWYKRIVMGVATSEGGAKRKRTNRGF
jgi:hypothetical protein